MEANYTHDNQESILDYPSMDSIDDTICYLKDPASFRSFQQGLIELLKRKNYPGSLTDINEMADYLWNNLKSIHSSIGRATLVSWLSGEHRPKVEANSRSKIYELCFSLNLTFEETIWFFQHVYYDRAFNCHNLREAVYYYAFLHQLSYQKAQEIIDEVEATPVAPLPSHDTGTYYTRFVQNQIAKAASPEELKEFLIANKSDFQCWNKSALSVLHDLISQLIGSAESRADIEELRKSLTKKTLKTIVYETNCIDIDRYNHCGLLIREILFDSHQQNFESDAAFVLDAIKSRNIGKNSFILDCLVWGHSGMGKNPDVPYIVRNNFPSKKTMSDILSEEKAAVSTSYDSIRKMIILLDFFRFWISVKLKIGYTDLTQSELAETYQDEANACLIKCGYEELFPVNPYDWLFLCSAQNENPLQYFRYCISEFVLA